MSDLTDGYIYVDYNHMDNAADDMVQQTTAISNTLASLEAELNELVKSWYGTDADMYREKQAAWHGAVENMKELLKSHSKLLTGIGEQYRYSEKQLTQMWSEVGIGR
ncbi:WXG100 family type VII secretion target [Streptomyces sp. S3(2020)]|uniref:WXG100 family type VII secretion target n=1 Tax=Streptomyces sp. S3(2020) TaxID=2732044 RepID=UPI001487B860|nr:WXG100 family type VII secretion target [Streptomyces sp. S3(2020)]NNN35648.1 WXG100 family type VII secretion target [Streptomyces sp. S3(2020)]